MYLTITSLPINDYFTPHTPHWTWEYPKSPPHVLLFITKSAKHPTPHAFRPQSDDYQSHTEKQHLTNTSQHLTNTSQVRHPHGDCALPRGHEKWKDNLIPIVDPPPMKSSTKNSSCPLFVKSCWQLMLGSKHL